MADLSRHLTISNFITIQNFIRVFRGHRMAARPPNGNRCHPACIAPASGLFAAGGCGVPVPQAFMGIGKTQKGLPVPPRLPHRFTGSPENFCGALLNAPTDTPTRANGRNPAKKRSPYSPDRRGTRGTHYQVGDIRSYLFNNITFYSLFLQSPHKCFPVPPASCRPASGLDVSKEASPAGHAPTGLPLRLSPR